MTVDRQNHFIKIPHIIIFALIVRIIYFSGFVLGDDPNYAENARIIGEDNYPSLCDVCETG